MAQLSAAHETLLIEHYGLDIDVSEIQALINKNLFTSLTKDQVNQILGRQDVLSGGLQIVNPLDISNFTIRLNTPLKDPKSGKERRYLRPAGQDNRLYVPEGLDYKAQEELWITEGEMKAVAGYLNGLPIVALSGIWGWRMDKGTTVSDVQKLLGGGKTSDISDDQALIHDLVANWSGKKIVLLYDSDITQHHQGWSAFGRLAEELYRLGAEEVHIYTLPSLGDEKTGLDDLILHSKNSNISIKDLVDGLKKKVEGNPKWIPSRGGLTTFTTQIAAKANSSQNEKVEGTSAILLSNDEVAASDYAGSFGKGKVALLKAAKAMAKQVRKRQQALPPLGKGVEYLATNVLSVISGMSSPPAAPKELIKDAVFKKIKNTFEMEGVFFSSSEGNDEAWWFYKAQKKMLSFSETDLETLFVDTSGLSKKGEYGSDSYSKLHAHAYQNGERILPKRLSYYDIAKNLLYIDLYNGEILRMDGRTIEQVDNGTDQVFFTHDKAWEPWKLVKTNEIDKKIFMNLMTGANFSKNSVLHPSCAKATIMAWRLAGFFREKQPTRPHLLLRGDKDSGKSSLARYWLWLLHGVRMDVSTINPDNIDQFQTVLTNQPWVCIDNLDGNVKKLEDILAIAATGGNVPKRILYTTNRMVNFPIVSWFTITSRTPKFRRDDIADRLLVIELAQLKRKRPEGKLKQLIQEKRNNYMSVLAEELNEMVAYFRDFGWLSINENFRMADFATFLRAYLYSNLGEDSGSQMTDLVLDQLKQAQAEFQVQDDTLLALIESLLQKSLLNETTKYTLPDILSAVNEEAMAQGLKFAISSSHTLGSMLRERIQAARTSGRLQIDVLREVVPNQRGTQTVVCFAFPQAA